MKLIKNISSQLLFRTVIGYLYTFDIKNTTGRFILFVVNLKRMDVEYVHRYFSYNVDMSR